MKIIDSNRALILCMQKVLQQILFIIGYTQIIITHMQSVHNILCEWSSMHTTHT